MCHTGSKPTIFLTLVDEFCRKQLKNHDAKEDISFRCLFGVEVRQFQRRSHNSPLRAAAARYLIRYAGQNQQGRSPKT